MWHARDDMCPPYEYALGHTSWQRLPMQVLHPVPDLDEGRGAKADISFNARSAPVLGMMTLK